MRQSKANGGMLRRPLAILACVCLVLLAVADTSVERMQASATTPAFIRVSGVITDGSGTGVPRAGDAG